MSRRAGALLTTSAQVALLSPFMRELVLLDGVGSTHDAPLLLPKQASSVQLPLAACCGFLKLRAPCRSVPRC